MTEPLTLDQVRETAKAVVAEHGADFRYIEPVMLARCLYAPTSHPVIQTKIAYGEISESNIAPGATVTGCLVGEILDRLGRRTDAVAAARTGIDHLVNKEFLVSATKDATDYLAWLQARQDGGETWGQALAYAEEMVD